MQLISARKLDAALVVMVRGEYGGECEIRAEASDLIPFPGGVKGSSVSVDHHQYGRYLTIAGILILLTAEQETSLFALLGKDPLPDAPNFPTHKGAKMDALSTSARECPICRKNASPEGFASAEARR